MVWFRNDLRLHDHPALHAATKDNHNVAALLLIPQEASKFWVESAIDLRRNLQQRGAQLYVRRSAGDVCGSVVRFVAEVGASYVHYHRGVTREERHDEGVIRGMLSRHGVTVRSFWGGYLYNPDKLPFRIGELPEDCDEFGRLVRNLHVEKALQAPEWIAGIGKDVDIGELPRGGVCDGGESAGLKRIAEFVGGGMVDVRKGRERSIDSKFGRLGPYLSVGCVSARQVWQDVMTGAQGVRRYCTELELLLREFVWLMTLKHGVHPA